MSNSWLKNKHLKLIGTADFSPHDYGHLLWHWGLITDQERDFLKTYGKLRGIYLACQERVPVWSHCHKYYSRRSKSYTEDEIKIIENKWQKLSRDFSLGKIVFLDWLTQEEINYNFTQGLIKEQYHRYIKKYRLIC